MNADQEYVSDVENYSEEYPQQILDDNSDVSDAESSKIVTDDLHQETRSQRFRNSLRKLSFVGKKQRRTSEMVKFHIRWMNIND